MEKSCFQIIATSFIEQFSIKHATPQKTPLNIKHAGKRIQILRIFIILFCKTQHKKLLSIPDCTIKRRDEG